MSDLKQPAEEKDEQRSGGSNESGGSGSSPIKKSQLTSGASAIGDALVGKELSDRYIVTTLLGTGAMGVVYKARHKLLDREVAIKVLKHDAANDENSRLRFESEAKAASALNHPNLIAVHDYGFMEDGTPFLVMDFLEGESLGVMLKREKRIETARLLSILKQVATGLGYAHAKGLVHRDLKPNNIMLLPYVSGRDLVKVVDFGIAKSINSDQDLTTTGQIFGTPFYMSPEQCQGHKLDGRSDIYSLGCLTYRIVAGKPPFAGDNAVATIVMHVKDNPPPFSAEALHNDMLRALGPIIIQMLEKDPNQRFQSCEELREALEKIELEQTTQKMSATTAKPDVPTAAAAAEGGAQSHTIPSADVPPQIKDGHAHAVLNPKMVVATTIGCILVALLIVALIGSEMFNRQKGPTYPNKPAFVETTTPNPAPVVTTPGPNTSGTSETNTSATSTPDLPQRTYFSDQPGGSDQAETQPGTSETMPEPAPQRPHRRSRRESQTQQKPHGIKGFFKRIFH